MWVTEQEVKERQDTVEQQEQSIKENAVCEEMELEAGGKLQVGKQSEKDVTEMEVTY